jgi:hypothetical protein
MIARFLLPLLSFAVLGFGQIGVYGPVATHLKAGDFAPDITFVETLNDLALRIRPDMTTSNRDDYRSAGKVAFR